VNSRIDHDQLSKAMNQLGQAAVDPAAWPDVIESICRAVGATAALLLQSDVRTADVPRTKSIDEATRHYFANNWHETDPRARGMPRLVAGEVLTDHDILTPDEIRADPMYNEVLRPFGFHWFAGIGFRAGSAPWVLTIQRTAREGPAREGPFEKRDKRLLATLAPRLTETATLSTAVGRAALSGMIGVLDRLRQPAVVLDHLGKVIDLNTAAAAGLDDDIRITNRQLVVRDKAAAARLDQLVSMIRAMPEGAALPAEPILVRRNRRRSVVVRVLPVDGAARTVFLGARAILLLSNLSPPQAPEASLISQALGLTGAESRLVSLLASGMSIEAAAEHLGIARETARNQLKAAFSKTGTHRQAELISLVSQLG
jgi:DNA-binding CsgD family transcriptional regulator